MIIESGVIIFVGLLLLAIKLPLRTNLVLLGRPLAVDLTAAIAAYVLHWGTFSGVMAAAVAGLMVSAMTSIGRKAFGYITPRDVTVNFSGTVHQIPKGNYVTGWWDMTHKLAKPKSQEQAR